MTRVDPLLPRLIVILCITAGLNLFVEGRRTRLNLSKLPAIATTSPSFLSLAIDSGVIANGFWPLNFSSPQLIALAKGLGPAYLRWAGLTSNKVLLVWHRLEMKTLGLAALLLIFSHSSLMWEARQEGRRKMTLGWERVLTLRWEVVEQTKGDNWKALGMATPQKVWSAVGNQESLL